MKKLRTYYKKHTYIALALVTATLIAAAGGGVVLARQNNAATTSASHVSNGSGYGNGNGNRQANNVSNQAEHEENHVAPLPVADVSNNPTTAKQLTYLIEEEKLAHDVYQAMYDTWGSKVFSNIIKSEASHQSEVLAVMHNRGITDPRSSKAGVFTDQSLQALYNKLVAQGKQSQTEAYKVGVAIEELDISDLKKDLASLDAADTDVKATLENLLTGSERHLTAFNRQLSR